MIPTGDARVSDAPTHEVLLVTGPIHYDFLLPLNPQTRSAFDFLTPHHPELSDPDARWLLLGWGARDFYATVGSYTDLSARAIWRGITGDDAVMRVDVVGAFTANFPVRKLALNDDQFNALLAAISGSFAAPEPLDHNGLGPTDSFYPATGRFNILRTCNVWVGEMIRAAGLRFGVWTPLPASVTLSHRIYTAK